MALLLFFCFSFLRSLPRLCFGFVLDRTSGHKLRVHCVSWNLILCVKSLSLGFISNTLMKASVNLGFLGSPGSVFISDEAAVFFHPEMFTTLPNYEVVEL